MNLFVLPSWYPSAANPVAGVFVRDQVQALVACHPDLQAVVGLWGHHDGALSLRDPPANWRALRWRALARESWRGEGQQRLHEVLTPRLSWTLKWGRGGAAGLLKASRSNLDLAIKRLGRIDLIHAHVGFPAGWIASVIGAERSIPYVLTEHMSPFPVRELLRGGQPNGDLRQAFEHASAVVVVSPALRDDVLAQGLPCSDVIPNVVDVRRFARAAAQWPAGSPFIYLALGGLTRRKGIDLLLDAFARWNPPAAEVRLHIGGEGPERPALESQVARLGLSDRVRFLGGLLPEQVPAALAQCHAFVLASRLETFGVVLAEALASGRPVLATQCGGPEAIVGPHDGFLVPADDVQALAHGLRQLREAAPRIDSAALRARAQSRFGAEAVAEQLLRLYARVLAP